MLETFNCINYTEDYGWVINLNGARFYSVYQSIHRCTGQVYGYEALLRKAATLGVEEPGNPFANLTDLEQTTLEFCALIIHLRNFPSYSKTKLFINLSPSILMKLVSSEEVMDYLSQTIVKKKLSAGQVCIEVTEQEHEGDLKLACQRCRDLGLEIAIDDYGDGGSNKERAMQIMPTVLKVSSSLLTRYMKLDRTGLLSALELAQELGSVVIVEGIDSLDKMLAMKKHKIDLLQGFYLGFPRDLLTQRELSHTRL